MAFFKRVFSADYRRALSAEAAGDYTAAARAYALAGERVKVAEMHLYSAERAGHGEARVAELRAGVRWAEGDDEAARGVRRRLGRALQAHVRSTGVISDTDRAVLAEAAALCASAGDFTGEGECHELAGDELAAAEAYQRAGDVERLEAVLARDEDRRGADGRQRDAVAEYQLGLASGARSSARAALRRVLATSPTSAHRALLDQLEARLVVDGAVTLAGPDGRRTYVASFPLGLGRERGCQLVLRDVGVSRRHAEILEGGGRFRVRDCGSKNGTLLAGMRIAGELPLEDDGELGLGDHCTVRFRAVERELSLDVVRGLDRGVRVVAGAGPFSVAGGAAELSFAGGWARLQATDGRTLLLNGVRAGQPVELLRGDRVELPGAGAIEVV